jgi:glutathione synthase/RimK-type ligase-like ATP-grasp enzyme
LNELKTIISSHFGTLEEFLNKKNNFSFPVVIKKSAGSKSIGVFKADHIESLLKYAKKASRSRYLFKELWEIGRSIKHRGYIKESKYRNKFVVQNFIPDLKNDWKILIFGSKYYILHRSNRKCDFRASGSGFFAFQKEIPAGILEFAKRIFDQFDVPFISMDIGFDNQKFHVLELQFVYFGTTTLEKAPFYYKEKGLKWDIVIQDSIFEDVYVESIVKYIDDSRLKANVK